MADPRKRKLGADGELELSEKQQQFLDWLMGDRPEGETLEQFAERLGVHSRTLHRWKGEDRAFLKRWEDRMRETYAHPDTLSKQLAVLNEKALKGDVKAIELYWRIVDRLSPDRDALAAGESVEQLSDERLEELLTAQLQAEAERRRSG